MNLKKNLFIVALASVAVKAKAQTLNDAFYLNFTTLPETKYKNGTGDFQTSFFELNVSAPPLEISKAVKWFNSLYYRNTSMSFSDIGRHEHHYPSQLNDIRYSSVFRMQLNNNFEFVAIPRVMIRGDLKQSLNQNDLFLQAVLLGTYAVNGNPNFRIGLGIALNNDFERNAIIPIGSLYYDSKRFKAEVVYPNANFLYKYSDKFEFGIFTSVDGCISRIKPFVQNGVEISYFRNFQLLIAPTITHQLYKNIFGHLKAGFSPVRYYENLDSDFKQLNNQRNELENIFFIRAGISLRIKN